MSALATGPSPMTWRSGDSVLELTPEAVISPLGRHDARAQLPRDARPARRLRAATPLIERLWAIACDDVERSVVEADGERYLGAGAEWGVRVYTRDIAFSGVLGCNRLWPELMRASLDYTRRLRWRVGFQVEEGYHELDGLGHVPWVPVAGDSRTFMARHHTNSYARRTDDVVWLWAAADLVRAGGGAAEDWRWIADWGERFFARFYFPFYDPVDGLFRGQATFCDIHSPRRQASGYPEEWSIADCLHVKAIGTNSLYALGMAALAEAHTALGDPAAARIWRARRADLVAAIRGQLRRPDGGFAYYKRRDGTLEPRRDALGTALAIHAGVVVGDEAAAIVEAYPRHWWGAPMYDPFFATERSYHNRSSWPFVDALFLWAEQLATGRDTAPQQVAWSARALHPEGGYAELVGTDGRPRGSAHQLWSAAGFIAGALRGGWLNAHT